MEQIDPMRLPIVKLPSGRTLHDPRLVAGHRNRVFRLLMTIMIASMFVGGMGSAFDMPVPALAGMGLTILAFAAFCSLTRIWDRDDRIYREGAERLEAKIAARKAERGE